MANVSPDIKGYYDTLKGMQRVLSERNYPYPYEYQRPNELYKMRLSVLLDKLRIDAERLKENARGVETPTVFNLLILYQRECLEIESDNECFDIILKDPDSFYAGHYQRTFRLLSEFVTTEWGDNIDDEAFKDFLLCRDKLKVRKGNLAYVLSLLNELSQGGMINPEWRKLIADCGLLSSYNDKPVTLATMRKPLADAGYGYSKSQYKQGGKKADTIARIKREVGYMKNEIDIVAIDCSEAKMRKRKKKADEDDLQKTVGELFGVDRQRFQDQ